MDGGTTYLLKAAIAQFNLSGRGYDRILKVSRTIADTGRGGLFNIRVWIERAAREEF